jgi:hypothetical protein
MPTPPLFVLIAIGALAGALSGLVGDLRSAVVIALTLRLCAWIVSLVTNRVSGPYLRLMFGVSVTGLG